MTFANEPQSMLPLSKRDLSLLLCQSVLLGVVFSWLTSAVHLVLPRVLPSENWPHTREQLASTMLARRLSPEFAKKRIHAAHAKAGHAERG